MNKLEQQLAFIQELDRLKAIYRKAKVKADQNRYENSAEHSWHITLMAQVLQPYAADTVNIGRVVSMLLLHDIVEIDAGDTFAFADQALLDAQESKELEAANRIFGLLPQSQYIAFKTLWLEFEAATSEDARFAKAMDRMLPLVQNMQNSGGSWQENNVKRSQALARNHYLKDAAPTLWQYACEQIDLATKNGWLIDE